jgi:phosphonate transport system substrate-binding protein
VATIAAAIISAAVVTGIAAYAFRAAPLEEGEPITTPPGTQPGAKTQFITLGTVGQDAEKELRLLQPTADYLASKLSTRDIKYSGKVVVARDAAEMVELLKNGKVDIYFDGSLAATLVGKQAGSVQFLNRWGGGVESYRTLFVARSDSPVNTLGDLAGKTMAFEDPHSTSGYLLPKAYLLQRGFAVVEGAGARSGAITYTFTGDSDNTSAWVVEGRVDAGALSNIEYGLSPAVIRTQLKIIDRTFEVPHFTLSYRQDLNPVFVEKIKRTLLDMDNDPVGIKIMKDYGGTTKYTVITERDPLLFNVSSLTGFLG